MKINKPYLRVATISFLALASFFIANKFSVGVNWTAFDFVAAGLLLFTAGFVAEFLIAKATSYRTKLLIGAGILSVFSLIWVELAVGIINLPPAGN